MKKIYRATEDQKLGGVIGGFGDYFEVDPNILRLLTILLCIASGFFPVIITYFVAWIILPESPQQASKPNGHEQTA